MLNEAGSIKGGELLEWRPSLFEFRNLKLQLLLKNTTHPGFSIFLAAVCDLPGVYFDVGLSLLSMPLFWWLGLSLLYSCTRLG